MKNQKVEFPGVENEIFIKREDLIHPYISGNKYRKLKYNLIEAKNQNHKNLLTFGGAFSNHILAVAYAGKENDFQTVGVIRGEELGGNLEKTLKQNDTLRLAQSFGMQFHFISREGYKNKESDEVLNSLKRKYGEFYLLPEGGTNHLAIKGCEEILTEEDKGFDLICCSVGTGGTISGLINSAKAHQKVLGFSALKGEFLQDEINKLVKKENWQINTNYHFGGYAKINNELVAFLNQFYEQTEIPLDPIYTGKMMYGIIDLCQKGLINKNTRILAVHSGGLQGIAGMNKHLKKKNLNLIEYSS
ncbi:1-aminocyclopropane-1-carboxylate deaminase/D-cysteine desulfhydrase [Mesonia sp. K7]|uniref:1-aminocyclopropane-1-carboxylate deaminase/D-cysteine desulfhydrase n=1 Tax=Mesonia sp. K7 TaxID=2218606 RepID=UPI000DA98A24|nr:pyridoxal-phosphate dependent enzyme [Mesonia sp. K7]PZD78663.1 1-aminocyclopropane-1-carboxylate deaminase/D-cysteine desulfhydrase [Mesonia sp. K7]